MRFLIRFLTFLSKYTKRLSICANIGLLAGAIAGITLSALDLIQAGITLTNLEAVYISLILTGFTWLIALFVLCVFSQMTFRSVALSSLFNNLLVCFFTVFISKYLLAYSLAWLIGILVGLLVGLLLCRLNHLFRTKE